LNKSENIESKIIELPETPKKIHENSEEDLEEGQYF
jgi:hypothetical protein